MFVPPLLNWLVYKSYGISSQNAKRCHVHDRESGYF